MTRPSRTAATRRNMGDGTRLSSGYPATAPGEPARPNFGGRTYAGKRTPITRTHLQLPGYATQRVVQPRRPNARRDARGTTLARSLLASWSSRKPPGMCAHGDCLKRESRRLSRITDEGGAASPGTGTPDGLHSEQARTSESAPLHGQTQAARQLRPRHRRSKQSSTSSPRTKKRSQLLPIRFGGPNRASGAEEESLASGLVAS